MLNAPSTVFFDHSRHKLWISELDTSLDVLVFTGTERLSEPFSYRIEFTSTDQDIAVERVLNRQASFSLYAAPKPLLKAFPGFPEPEIKPLRTLHGVITAFQRLSGSNDEARYAVTLEPRLALLGRGKQTRIYQHQSVPQIVEKVLRSRHEFLGQDFYFNIVREYPPRLQVMQYDESDLAFITRLLAEVGIWFRFATDERLRIEVVEFHDDQRHYLDPRPSLPSRPPSGLSGGDQDAVWALQASHQVVEQRINFRAYDPRKATAWLDGEVDQTRGATTTYGEAYHYAEGYTELGGKLDQDEDLLSESGFFYARLRHERYLNKQTRLSGTSNSATLALAQVLEISGAAPQAFAPGAVITRLTLSAARDTSLLVNFEAIPYVETVCFRPPLQKKPSIAGTLPARVTSNRANDPYSHINLEGRYKVNFLFDRDDWKQGEESLWLRLARPYAGDTHGLHLPLICGTEVAIAFEQGDPDRPYIAHALHDNKHPDHVTLARHDYKRNVLRTPANNKLRMEDERGQEHIKLSTEHSGKSQLSLGYLVDAQKQKRGEGFELRTDGWGAIRGGKGLFISAEAQAKAQGQQLEMAAAVERLQQAGEQLEKFSDDALASETDSADVQAQLDLLRKEIDQLKASGLLLSAPDSIAATSGKHLQLAAQRNLMLNAGHNADVSVVRQLFMGVGQGLRLFVRKLGIDLIANSGPVKMQAQNDQLEILARQGLTITSTEDEIHITAKKKIVLNGGGSYISIDPCRIESGTAGDYKVKAADFEYSDRVNQDAVVPALPPQLDIPPELHAFLPSFSGGSGPASQVQPKPLDVEELEEEEEEEEFAEGITLRLGLFFDGTGNNMANSAATEQCRREDLEMYSESDLESIAAACREYGFDGFTGSAFTRAPDNSYGNAPSNVVYLRELYPDNAATRVSAKAEVGYIKVYVEGIGTRSGGKDATVAGQGLGRGETGVVARVEQTPRLLKEQLNLFQQTNLHRAVQRIEVDIFGFSRGAAAARHCANEFLKPGRGVFGDLLEAGRFGLLESFDPSVDIRLNLIGLFDTVTAISTPERGDFSPANNDNHGINLYLPPGCARKVIQLHARDESRLNFGLNAVGSDHLQIALPGVHSDVGGGYLPYASESVWLVQPQRITVDAGQSLGSHPEWQAMVVQAQRLRDRGLTISGRVEAKAWLAAQTPAQKNAKEKQAYWMTVTLERDVRGELALVALRVMRELGVRHGVPFDEISDEDSRFKMPVDLRPIADQILQQVLANSALKLSVAQESLLRERYIHRSAHWTPTKGFMLAKPAPDNRRNVFPDEPQRGYPQ